MIPHTHESTQCALRPSFPFGNMGDIYMQRKPFFDGQLDVFKQLEGHKYVLHLEFRG